MTSGDLVNGISPLNTTFSFQPAGTNTFILTHLSNKSDVVWLGTIAGSGGGYLQNTVDALTNTKVGITNTNFIWFDTVGVGIQATYSGIQVN